MKRAFLFLSLILAGFFGFTQTYSYETFPNDPMKTRIYTLKNGLKVFLTDYKDEPKIYAYVAVKVGSKNDPPETTGMAHYFEHMMFKGTTHFGTENWEKEQPMIAQIDSLFEIYRTITDAKQRAGIYHLIDSISYEASKLALPNEYDKMMNALGSSESNAFTSEDYTMYVENISSNQLESWAEIQADRFLNPVLRLFHTELETIYEEKNMSLTEDLERAFEKLYEGLFPDLPYGQQSVLGSQEHLKNPSMTNLRKFFADYYVANNMAVVLSGDLDFDKTIAIIDKNFSKLPSGNVPKLNLQKNPDAVKGEVIKEVVGFQEKALLLGFRIDKPANSKEYYTLLMLSEMLSNDAGTGLLDLNLCQKQKVMAAQSFPITNADCMGLAFYGEPRSEKQSLDAVKNLILEQVSLLKNGDFEDWMTQAATTAMKLQETKTLENNETRGYWIAESFTNDIPWKEGCQLIERLGQVTKQDVVDFANKYLTNDYVVVYKKQGKPIDILSITQPPITPIFLERNSESNFLQDIKSKTSENIEPVFVNFDKEITKKPYKGTELIYVENKENELFTLAYYFPMGEFHDLKLPVAMNYLNYLGTSQYSAEQLAQEFYKIGCTLETHTRNEETFIQISGLNENLEKALALAHEMFTHPKSDEEILKNIIDDIVSERKKAKSSQEVIFTVLRLYAIYGSDLANYQLNNKQLKALTSQELLNIITGLNNYEHKILYYGPEPVDSLEKILEKHHPIADKLQTIPEEQNFSQQETTTNQVLFTTYNTPQATLYTYSRSIPFNPNLYPVISLYNNYFGGGMSCITFQEMREKRSLAYIAISKYKTPTRKDRYFENIAYIGTQNDKIVDAFDAFDELFNKMPISETAFQLAKEGLKKQLETERITKMNIIWNYLSNQKMGINNDIRENIYGTLPSLTLEDVAAFNQEYIQEKPKIYIGISRKQDTDFKRLKKFGTLQKLSLKEIFGY